MTQIFKHAMEYPAYPGAFLAQAEVEQINFAYSDFEILFPCPCPECQPHYPEPADGMPFRKAQAVLVTGFGEGYVFQEGLHSSTVFVPGLQILLTASNEKIQILEGER